MIPPDEGGVDKLRRWRRRCSELARSGAAASARRLWHSPTATTWGSLGVRLAGVLVLLPVVLVRFTPADVALWQLFTTLYIVAMLLDFGLAPTFTRMLAFARGGTSVADMADMRRSPTADGRRGNDLLVVFNTQRWLYPRLALGVLAVLGVACTFALARAVAQTTDPVAAWTSWAVVLGSTAAGLWGGGYSAALQGMDRIATMRRWEVLTGLAQIVSSIAVLAYGGGLLALVLVYQAWVVVAAVRNRLLLRALHPELFVAPAQPDRRVLALLWPMTWRTGLGVLMGSGITQLSGVFYSQLAPAAEVASYLLALRVMTLLSQFAQAPFYSKLPRLAELQSTGDRAAQLRLAQRGMAIAHAVFVAGAVGIALLVAPALDLIGSRTHFVEPVVWALMALAFFAERYGAMHLQLYTLTNHIVWHVANGISGLIIVLLVLASYRTLGVLAFPAAMFVAYCGFYCTYSATRTRKAFGLRILSFERRAALPAAVALLLGLGASLLVPWST